MSGKKCNRCDGCGMISNVDATPWSELVGSSMDQESIDINGRTHFARVCGRCNGLGFESPKDPDALV